MLLLQRGRVFVKHVSQIFTNLLHGNIVFVRLGAFNKKVSGRYLGGLPVAKRTALQAQLVFLNVPGT